MSQPPKSTTPIQASNSQRKFEESSSVQLPETKLNTNSEDHEYSKSVHQQVKFLLLDMFALYHHYTELLPKRNKPIVLPSPDLNEHKSKEDDKTSQIITNNNTKKEEERTEEEKKFASEENAQSKGSLKKNS